MGKLLLILGFVFCYQLALAQDDYYEDEPVDNYDAYDNGMEQPPTPVMNKDIPINQQMPQEVPVDQAVDDYAADPYAEPEPYPDDPYPVNEDAGNYNDSY